MWALFMTAGGHFAGMIVRVSKPGIAGDATTGKKSKSAKNVPDMEVLAHKTFHRYTSGCQRSVPAIELSNVLLCFLISSTKARRLAIRE